MSVHVELQVTLFVLGYMLKCLLQCQKHFIRTFIKCPLNLTFQLDSTEKQLLLSDLLPVVCCLKKELPFSRELPRFQMRYKNSLYSQVCWRLVRIVHGSVNIRYVWYISQPYLSTYLIFVRSGLVFEITSHSRKFGI